MDAPDHKVPLYLWGSAETHATSRPTKSAGRPDISWVRDTTRSGCTAAACSPPGSCQARRFRSPKSSHQDVASFRARSPDEHSDIRDLSCPIYPGTCDRACIRATDWLLAMTASD